MKPYLVSPEAEADLDSIHDFIAADDPDAARRVILEIRDAVRRLAEMPHLGHERKDITDQPVRFWPVYTYLIVYRPESRPLEIARVVSGYRNLAQHLSGL
ncbi:MAG: type II toxin-antitoxin system RelE/ParE family toxin [Planctomycetes bacterium]|nr:type II toxin-antitoxin system RelE/ParE family toxin [Planctomycetota bacterium]MBI3846356.1 type II toxin-antitoxin system RelE/ParE family toxin [Planctomycetota bacterium]